MDKQNTDYPYNGIPYDIKETKYRYMLQHGWSSKICQLKKSGTKDLKMYFICVLISRQGKFVETDHCSCLGLGAAAGDQLQRSMRGTFMDW